MSREHLHPLPSRHGAIPSLNSSGGVRCLPHTQGGGASEARSAPTSRQASGALPLDHSGAPPGTAERATGNSADNKQLQLQQQPTAATEPATESAEVTAAAAAAAVAAAIPHLERLSNLAENDTAVCELEPVKEHHSAPHRRGSTDFCEQPRHSAVLAPQPVPRPSAAQLTWANHPKTEMIVVSVEGGLMREGGSGGET